MSQASLISTAPPSPIFSFKNHEIRTVMQDDQPWFVARDVCAALNIDWSGKTLSAMPAAWQRMGKLPTHHRGEQNMRIISEPAVYKLAFRSNKTEADEFTNWVASEVLPAIRKTGKYETTPAPAPKAARKALGRGIKALPAAAPFIPEKGREIMERLLALRGTLYRVSSEMQEVMSAPFWDTPTRPCPAHFKPFAKAMNSASWAFVMSVNKELETAALLYEAFVEAEKALRACPAPVQGGMSHA